MTAPIPTPSPGSLAGGMSPPAQGSRSARGRLRRWMVLAILVLSLGLVLYQFRPRPDPLRLLQAAWLAFESGRPEQARALLDLRAQQAAPAPLDWMLRARIAGAQHRYDEALEWLRKIPETDPLAAEAWLQAGEFELDRDRARHAETAFRRALSLDPTRGRPHRELAYIYAMQARRPECDAEFRTLAAQGPLDHRLAFVWCQNRCGLWDPNEAYARLLKFTKADPDDRWSQLALARSLVALKRPDEADQLLAPFGDDDPEALAVRVESALSRNDQETARSLVARGPADHAALNRLRGRLALARQEGAAAAGFYRAALRQDADDRDALYGLAQALRMSGDDLGAAPLFQAVQRHDRLKRLILDCNTTLKDDPRVFSKLGEACEALNLRLEAITWYRLAIIRDPLDRDAQRALARVEKGEPTSPGDL